MPDIRRMPLLLMVAASVSVCRASDTTAPATQPATLPAHTPASQSVAMREIVNREQRFRLKCPADWIEPEHPANGQVFSVQKPGGSPQDTQFGVVGLRIDNGPEGMSDKAILMDLSGSIAGAVFKSGGKKITVKPDTLGVIAARRIRFLNEQPAATTEVMYVIAVKKRIEYVFNVAAPQQQFEEMLPAVEELLKSFEVLD